MLSSSPHFYTVTYGTNACSRPQMARSNLAIWGRWRSCFKNQSSLLLCFPRLLVEKPLSHALFKTIRRLEIFWQRSLVNNHTLRTRLTQVIQKARVAVRLEICFGFLSVHNTGFFPHGLNEFHRVEVNIRNKVLKVTILACMRRFKLTLEKRSRALVARVEVHRVTGQKPLHKSANATVALFLHKEMKMIRHQAVRTDIYERRAAHQRKKFWKRGAGVIADVVGCRAVAQIEQREKSSAIAGCNKDISLFRPAIVQVEEFTGREHDVSCHVSIVIPPPTLWQGRTLPLLTFV